MADSILSDTKKILGVPETDTGYDLDILMHINSVLSTLNQLGIGPVEGFSIEDASATWAELLADDPRLNSVKTYIYLRVRMLFDPPGTSFLLGAMQDQIKELEWRISTQRESTVTPSYLDEIDGGTALVVE